ncbi:MAG: cadmium-translocating P-type ATPase [Clostridia bacterium]|nr:cadmium-translocating P-type ATPase [Clostridia bacterium]
MSDNFISFDDFLKERAMKNEEPQEPVKEAEEAPEVHAHEEHEEHEHEHHAHTHENKIKSAGKRALKHMPDLDIESEHEHLTKVKSKLHHMHEVVDEVVDDDDDDDDCCDHCHDHHHHHDHDDGCACGHEHSSDNKIFKYLLIGAAVLFVVALILKKVVATPIPSAILFVLAAGMAGAPVFANGVKNAIEGDIDEAVLMTIAVVAAILLGDFAEAAAVAVLFRVGEMMEEYASDKSRQSIRALSEIQPDTANVFVAADTVKKVPAEKVKKGTRIAIYPHERVPLDCIVLKGSSTVDASAITGESMPVQVSKGSQILSGSVNGNETIVAKTTNNLKESAASRIIQMVEEASSKKSKSQKAISKIANVYTPIVMAIALIVALVPSIITHDWATWTHRALVLLVIACPCALVLSVPLGFFTSLGTAARKGILVKGSRYIEELAQAKCVAFDKTGTLTTNNLKIESVTSPVGLDPEAVLLLAAIADHTSTHPVAMTIKAAAKDVPDSQIKNIKEIPGYGTYAEFCGKKILCGSKKMFDENGIPTGDADGILVGLDNRLVGNIIITAEVRDEADDVINDLRLAGIERIVMLTGDSYESAKNVAENLGVDEFYSDMLPGDKLEMVEQLQQALGKVVYVGDGINDAPVLAAADVGVGMGLGSAAALESADVVLTNSSISKLAEARALAEKTMRIFKGNVTFIMAVKILVMILGIAGIAPMWLAVFSDVGVCFISVLISSLIASDKADSLISRKNQSEDFYDDEEDDEDEE